jgi:hypothetical protein
MFSRYQANLGLMSGATLWIFTDTQWPLVLSETGNDLHIEEKLVWLAQSTAVKNIMNKQFGQIQ